MNMGGGFWATNTPFEVGTRLQVDVQAGVVQKVEINEMIMHMKGAIIPISPATSAQVTIKNVNGSFSWRPSSVLNKTKAEGFYRRLVSPVRTFNGTGETRQDPGCTGEFPVPRSQACNMRINPYGGFVKMSGASFGGPFQLLGKANAVGVDVNMGIFGNDQTRYRPGGGLYENSQALMWANGQGKVRIKADGQGIKFSPSWPGQPAWEFDSGAPTPWVQVPYGNQNTGTKPSITAKTGAGPVYNAAGATAYPTWAAPAGAMRKVYSATDPGPWSVNTKILNTVGTSTMGPETVTFTLVSPAIMEIGQAMGTIGVITFHLQRVPEPTTAWMLGASALSLGLLSIRRKKR